MSQILESIAYGLVGGVAGILAYGVCRSLRACLRGGVVSKNRSPAPNGPPPVSQVKPPPPPAPPPPSSSPAARAGRAERPLCPRVCDECGAAATHLMGLELAGVADPGKARMTIARPLCPRHAAELPRVRVLDRLSAGSWIEIEGAYIARGWGHPEAGRSRFYGVPIDESYFADQFEPAPAGGRG